MEITVSLKSPGRRRPALQPVAWEVPEGIGTLKGLVSFFVREEVRRFNSGAAGARLVPFLSSEQVEVQAAQGKVGFGERRSDRLADPLKAVDTALRGFEDGLFRVVANGREIKDLDAPLELRPGDSLTFIRLTFLAGRLW